jgi:hypothetical protein
MPQRFWNGCGLAALLVLTLCVWPAAAQVEGAPRAEKPVFIPPGSSWVMAYRNSGSYGSENRNVTLKSLGEQTWAGRKVFAYDIETITLLVDAATSAYVARVREGKPVETWDPPIGWSWPLWVGKTWTLHFRYTNHQAGWSSNVQAWYKVEAYEDVRVPAGQMKAFRISYSDGGTQSWTWWNPETGVPVKTRIQRSDSHPAGRGVREGELVSQDLKK